MLSTLTPEQQKTCDEAVADCKLIILARQVRDNPQFRDILKQAAPNMRRAVYDRIKPYLRFKPKPYFLFKF